MRQEQVWINYYHWSLEQAQQEVDSDFELIRHFEDAAYRFMLIAHPLQRHLRLEFLTALVRRVHKWAMELLGERLSPVEERWIHHYLQGEAPSSQFSRAYHERATRLDIGESRALSSKYFLRFIKSCNLFPSPEYEIASKSGLIEIKSVRAGLCLLTRVDIGGRSHQASFGHTIVDPVGDRLLHDVDPIGSLGISAAQWLSAEETQAQQIGSAIHRSDERFKTLIERLVPKDTSS
jgi:hypothetical protein